MNVFKLPLRTNSGEEIKIKLCCYILVINNVQKLENITFTTHVTITLFF